VLRATGDHRGTSTSHARLVALDGPGGAPWPGATVTLSVPTMGFSCTSQTDADGNASCVTPPITAGPGPLQITASYAGDSAPNVVKTGSSATGTLLVTQEETSTAYVGATFFSVGSTVTLKGKLTEDGTNSDATPAVSGRNLTLTLASVGSCSAGPTAADGTASCTISGATMPNTNGGTLPITVAFAGDAYYLSSSGSATAKSSAPTHFTTALGASGNGEYNDPSTVAATLTTSDTSAPISSAQVSVTLDGSLICPPSVTTDANGNATCTFTPSVPGGPHTVTFTYAGDASHLPSTLSTPYNVNREETTITYTGSTWFAIGFSAKLSAHLIEDTTGPVIAGRTVTITLGSHSCTGVTDANGDVTCTTADTVSASDPTPMPITARFAGDPYYVPATAKSSANTYAFPGAGTGTFVIGDITERNATAKGTRYGEDASIPSINYWGSQWENNNRFTQDTLPPAQNPNPVGTCEGKKCSADAMKGYVDLQTPLQPTCGLWTSRPGNSSNPPAGPLPKYMAIIVSSWVHKAPGMPTSGNIYRLVIVKTGSDYKNDPGHEGFGPIVAQICATPGPPPTGP